jgi:hypothetical protein
MRESIYHSEGKDYHAVIEELSMGEDDYQLLRSCRSEFVFEGDRYVACCIHWRQSSIDCD